MSDKGDALTSRHPAAAPAPIPSTSESPVAKAKICGVSKAQRVHETIEWAQWPVPAAVWTELDALSFTRDDPEATRAYVLG